MIVSLLLKFIAVLLSLVPYCEPLINQVDLVEINNYYADDALHPPMIQIIYYEWVDDHFEIIAWRLVKNDNIVPIYNHETKQYESTFFDGEQLRKVISKSFIETWTHYDPELVARNMLPVEHRKGLLKWTDKN